MPKNFQETFQYEEPETLMGSDNLWRVTQQVCEWFIGTTVSHRGSGRAVGPGSLPTWGLPPAGPQRVKLGPPRGWRRPWALGVPSTAPSPFSVGSSLPLLCFCFLASQPLFPPIFSGKYMN